MSQQKKPGTWWFWYYRDALKSGSTVPTFTIEGRKNLLGFLLGTRQQLSDEQLKSSASSSSSHCLIFFPKADHSTDQFAASLIQSFKSSVILSRQKANIHLFITCPTVEHFDQHTKNIPSGVNVWADVNGELADKFGMRPNIQNIDLNDLLGESNEKKRNTYSKQTITGMFFTVAGKIVKSPAFQPKLQTISLDTMKSVYDFIDKSQYNVTKITAPDSYASDLSENDLKTLHSAAWSEYEKEYKQMKMDIEGKSSDTPQKPKRKKPTTATKSTTPATVNKKVPTKTSTKSSTNKTTKTSVKKVSPPQRLSKL